MKEREKIEVDLDKVVELYCFINNSIQVVPRFSLWSYLFGGSVRDDAIEDYFASIKGRIVDILDSGLKERSGLVRTVSPFRVEVGEIKKHLKS